MSLYCRKAGKPDFVKQREFPGVKRKTDLPASPCCPSCRPVATVAPTAQFEIHSVDRSRAEQAFALASLNFATQSVLHKAFSADLEEYRAYLRPTFFNDLGDGLSLMATGPGNGELMGILVVRHFRKQQFAGGLPYQDKYDQISALFEELEAIYLQTRQFAAGDALLVDMAAVPPAHAGKGIYQALRMEISIRAKSLGHKYIIGELTSTATQKVVLEKMGTGKVPGSHLPNSP